MEDNEVRVGKTLDTTKPAKVNEVSEDPEVQKAIRAAIRQWRMDQFFWGWCWAIALDLLLVIVVGSGSILTCVLFAFNIALALHLQKKTRNIPVYVLKKL